MTPWEETGVQLFVLRNVHRQHSLWPDFADFPADWVPVFGPASAADWVPVFGPASAADCRAYLAGDRQEHDLDS